MRDTAELKVDDEGQEKQIVDLTLPENWNQESVDSLL